ncbi:MAG: hypothetical protein AB1416_05120 [Actinomycetota bacterium]
MLPLIAAVALLLFAIAPTAIAGPFDEPTDVVGVPWSPSGQVLEADRVRVAWATNTEWAEDSPDPASFRTHWTELAIRPKANAGWRLVRAEIWHVYRHGADRIIDSVPNVGRHPGFYSDCATLPSLDGLYTSTTVWLPSCKGAPIRVRGGTGPEPLARALIFDTAGIRGLDASVRLQFVTVAISRDAAPKLKVRVKFVLCRPAPSGRAPCALYVFTDLRRSRPGHESQPCNRAGANPPTCTLRRYAHTRAW